MKKDKIVIANIERLNSESRGVANIIFNNKNKEAHINNCLPKQVVKAKIKKIKKSALICNCYEVIKDSPDEKEIPFQKISSAPYIKLPIKKQIELKRETNLKLFDFLEDLENIFDEFIESPITFHYRNKMEYSFSSLNAPKTKDDNFFLGLKKSGTWWSSENINKSSGMFDEVFENNLSLVREFLEKTNLKAWNTIDKKGFFRFLIARKSFYLDKILINLITSSKGLDRFNINAFSDFMYKLYNNKIAGIMHTINDDISEIAVRNNYELNIIRGSDSMEEKINDLTFNVNIKSFFQTNPKAAELLYDKVISYIPKADNDGKNIIMDLFCGTGTIGQIIASKNSDFNIIGIDIIKEAIDNAKENAKINKLNNISFEAYDIKDFISISNEYKDKVSTIILDPPRSGVSKKTLKKILLLNSNYIIYISCKLSVLAKQIKIIHDNSTYRICKLSFVDMFPNTPHLEGIALFKKN